MRYFSHSKPYERLVAAAKMESKTSKAPCHYFGLEFGTNKYEPDPHKWTDAAMNDRKSHVNVFYEWQHVATRDSCRKASCNINILL